MDKQSALSALAALGQDTRLEVFRLLVKAGGEGIPAGDIASRLGIVQNTMSAHLKVLDQAGLVRAGARRANRPLRRRHDRLSRPASLSDGGLLHGVMELCRGPVIDAD